MQFFRPRVPRPRTCFHFRYLIGCFLAAALLGPSFLVAAGEAMKQRFDLREASAEAALKQFSIQSGRQVIVPTELASGVRTNPVRGEFTAQAALDQLLAGTGLIAAHDETTGAFAIKRAPVPNGPRAARVSRDRPVENENRNVPATAVVRGRSSANETSEESPTITLSPFEVNADLDRGYRAGGTLAGTRLRSDLRDVAASVSVVTKDFLSDIAANDLGNVLNYTVGTEVTGVSGNFSGAEAQASFVAYDGVVSSPTPVARIRGLGTADLTRDYFLSDVPLDSYITDRVEINRGANAMLFGLGSPAGIINNGLIKARADRDETEVQMQLGRFGTHRLTFDHNQALIRDRLALRVATLYGQRKYQPESTFSRDKRAFVTATYRPFRSTTIRVNSEWARREENRPWSRPPFDNFTYWWDYGQPTYNPSTNRGVMLGTPRESTLAGINASGSMNSTLLGFGLGQTFNANGLGLVYEDPNSDLAGISGLRPGTQAIEANNERMLVGPTGTLINGGFAQLRQGQIYSRFANGGTTSPASNFWRDFQITDPAIFDFYDYSLEGPNKREWADWRTYNVTLEQTFLRGMAGVELAFDKQDFDAGNYQPLSFRGYAINIDINTHLPDGTPNANFGRPFVESIGGVGSSGSNREALRATAYFDLDLAKHLRGRVGQALGRHVLTLNYTDQQRENYGFGGRPAIAGLDFYLSESATVPNLSRLYSSGRRALSQVAYIGPSLINASSALGAPIQAITAPSLNSRRSSLNALYYQSPPVGATTPSAFEYRTFEVIQNSGKLVTETTNFSPSRGRQEFESAVAVLQSKWFNGNLVSTLGWRRDDYATFLSQGAGADPVTGRSLTDPSVLFAVPSLADSHSTFSYGFVAHSPAFVRERLPLGTSVSFTYNQSENFRPTNQRYSVLGTAIDAETGTTKEYGVLITTLGGKLELRATHYESSASLATNNALNTVQGQIARLPDEVIEANSLGVNDDQPAGLAAWQAWQQSPIAQRFFETFRYQFVNNPDGTVTVNPGTTSVASTSDIVSKGWEFEAAINPTRQWRIAVNAAKQEAVRTNTARELRAFLADVGPTWLDAAGDIRHVSSSTETLRTYVSNLIGSMQKEVLLDGSASPELRKWRFNLVTNYRFAGTRLKGWSVGGALRWQDKIAIGYPVIADATTGPRYDVSQPFFGPAETNVDVWVGYGRELNEKIDWRVQLNVRNVGVGNKLIPIATQPDGSIAAYRIAEPMVWTLTNTFKF